MLAILPRRLRSFSLRTLMVLFTVACVLAAWVARERENVRERYAVLLLIAEHPADFTSSHLTTPSWIRKKMGDVDVSLQRVRFRADRPPSGEEIELIKRAFPGVVVEIR